MDDNRPRARENCSFYPACYITGDCPENGWTDGKCGLFPADKEIERQKFNDRLRARTQEPQP